MKNSIAIYIIAAVLLLMACGGGGEMQAELQNID